MIDGIRVSLLPLLFVPAISNATPSTEPNAEVVVTATRSERSTLEVSGSLSRIDSAMLESATGRHQADALNSIPGVNIQRGSGQESLTAIRSPTLTGAGACGAFLFLENGLPIRPVGFCNVNGMFEVNYEQAGALEVLRGPGPALYGANAVHGIVNVLSPTIASLPQARLGLQTGADDFRRVALAGSQAFGESRLGVYGIATRDGGFRADSGVDEAKLNVLLERDLAAGKLRVQASGTVLNQETAGFIQGLDSYRNRAIARSNPNPEAYRDAWSTRLSANYQREPCAGCEEQWAAMLRSSWMEFSQHFLIGKPIETNEQTSAMLAYSRRFAPRDRWQLSVAADAEWAGTTLREEQFGPATEGSAVARAIRPAGLHYDYDVDALTFGAALQIEWRARERVTLGAALRADSTRYRYDNRMLAGNTNDQGVPCPFGGCLYARPADRDDTFTNATPKLDARLRLTPNTTLYAAATRGFRPPEMTELYRLQRSQTVADLESESLASLELGIKHIRGPLAAQFAAYTMRKRDVILRDSSGFNVSDGRTRHAGVEYDLRWNLAPAWSLALGGTFNRQTYDFSRAIDGGETITAGNEIDTAPRQLHSLAVDWRPTAAWSARAEAHYVGRYFADAANTAVYPGHTATELAVGWKPAPQWRIEARLENALDRAYADRADFAFGNYRYFPARGRSGFLSVEYTRR
jgi:outer membrane receptor protein involved in Fe transport